MSVSFLKKSELAALAAALALTAVAGEASAQDGRGRGNRAARVDNGEANTAAIQQRIEARQERQEQRQAQRAQALPQQAPAQAQLPGGGVQRAQAQAQRAEAQAQIQAQRAQAQAQRAQAQAQRSAQADAPRWGSQRPADGQRYGRDRDGTTVARPAPAWRGATPAVPQAQAPAQQAQRSDRTWQDRNRDGNQVGSTARSTTRNQTYRDASRDDRSRTTTRNQSTWRDNDRNGTRDRNWSGNNRTWGNNDRDRQAYRNGDYNRWDRNDWRRDRRYDWNRYRNQNRTVFRIGVYYSPYRNWSYRRFGIGSFLDQLFFSDRYWIDDPWQYRLPEVYGPYRWVRYYDDVLLVDIYSGEVVDVIYNFFW